MTESTPSKRDVLLAWLLYCMMAALIFMVYVAASVAESQGEIIMPLDDTYIHFQYARQITNLQPYVYNPGGEATSGATSFLYPYVLALGYAAGFDGLSLGVWAMAVGALALVVSAWIVCLLAGVWGLPLWAAWASGAIFMLNGAVSWHAMSGMETSLVVTLALALLYAIKARHIPATGLCASLLALMRPETGLMALLACAALLIHIAYNARKTRAPFNTVFILWLLVPFVAFAVQPMINLILTGSASASGSQAKSILGTVPFYWDEVIQRILENFTRIWREFATGGGLYLPVFVPPLALVGWAALLRKDRLLALVMLAWLLIMTGAVATLDTAFWHFKRYQIPLMALMFPLAAGGAAVMVSWLSPHLKTAAVRRAAAMGALLLALALTLPSSGEFVRLYRVNVRNIAAQPLPMARWLAANTPPDAVVAVHDVGMMRYLGERTTLDMVGLTTPRAADSWRSGPGAVGEFLLAQDPPPDYVAAYTTARGLNYLVDAGLYGTLLAGFTATYDPADNVAVGAEFQGIYAVEAALFSRASHSAVAQHSIQTYIDGFTLVDEVNVANLEDERAHEYTWRDGERLPGFSTEFYAFESFDCDPDQCRVMDGGRRINGQEQFTLASTPGQDVILVTRVHPASAGHFAIYAGEAFVGTRVIPAIPGRWLEIPTLIPAQYVTENQTRIRIVPHTPSGHYQPYHHWAWQGIASVPAAESLGQAAALFQDGDFGLILPDNTWQVQSGQLTLNIHWVTMQGAVGDYKVFVHLYDDINAPPIAQVDAYPGAGALPPGNWLPGVISDTLVVDLTQIPPGRYTIAVGLYEATSFERLLPGLGSAAETIQIDPDARRVFIGEVNIP